MRDFSSSPAWVISILLWVLLTSANRAIRMITGKIFLFCVSLPLVRFSVSNGLARRKENYCIRRHTQGSRM